MLNRFINVTLLKRVWEISWPTVIFSLMETLIGLLDIFWAGFLGNDALAAIGLCRQLYLILMISAMAITTGTIALVAQFYGANRYDKASEIAFHSIFLAVFAGIILGVLGIVLATPVLMLLGAQEQVILYGSAYLRIIMTGLPFLLINYSANGTFRALGDAKTPLKIALLTYLLNAVFSYVFVFGFWFFPAIGVSGIALGMVLSRAVGACRALWILSGKDRLVRLHGVRRLYLTPLVQILRIGLPVGIAGLMRNGARVVFFSIIASSKAGTAALAAAAIVIQIRMITIMPSLAFQVGVSALVGQSIGQKNFDDAENYGWTSIKLSSFIMGIISIIVFLMPAFFMRIFTQEEEVIRIGTLCMRFIVLEQFWSCFSIVTGGVLVGAGDTKPTLYYAMISQWFLMLPLAYILTHFSSHDILGAWMAWGCAPILESILIFSRFRSGKWKQMKLTEYSKMKKHPSLA